MADDSRIEELRRRLRKDPASIIFAQLAEELRRAGRQREAVGICRTGLAVYPDYLSARVTLGRALIELDRLDDAQRELEQVRRTAPENLTALRALAEIHERRALALQETAGSDGAVLSEPLILRQAQDERESKAADRSETDAFWRRQDERDSNEPALSERDLTGPEYLRIVRTLAALEGWLAAVYVTRAQRRA